MLKTAVIGAQTLLGRELVGALEPQECSVLPLSTGPLSEQEEEGDLVVFAPTPLLLEGIDVVLLADLPLDPVLLEGFTGRTLDLRPEAETALEPIPLSGGWPGDSPRLRVRPAVEQVLALLPHLVEGLGGVAGTWLRSVAHLGDRGLEGLVEQTMAVLKGEDPDPAKLGYRAAFEVVPRVARGRLMEVDVPSLHGDLLVLNLTAAEGGFLSALPAPEGVVWARHPPTSREVAVESSLLAHLHLDPDGRTGFLTLGFDPILWGTLRPAMRMLGLM
jgi:hypothetical protein